MHRWLLPLISILLFAPGCGIESFGATSTEVGVLPQSSTIQGRDGAASGVAWGHSVWTFGDTILNLNDDEGTNWHNNSYSITDDMNAADGIGPFTERLDSAGAPRYFLAPTPDEDAFNTAHRGDPCMTAPCGARWAVWPGEPLWDAARQRAIIFYRLIYAEPGDFNFHGVGQSLAIWDDFSSDATRPELTAGGDHPTLMWAQDEPGWGTAAVIDGAALYAFACDTGNTFSPPCYLAQVPLETVLDRSTWQFWNGHDWTPSMEQRQSVFVGASSVTIAKNAHLGKWTALYAQPLSNRVVIRTADVLTGPWSEAKLLFDAKGTTSAYDATWHPEYDDGDMLCVSFSRSTNVGWFGSEFPLERVTLP
jgi:hypothetical protein